MRHRFIGPLRTLAPAACVLFGWALFSGSCGPRPERCDFATDCPPDGRVYTCEEGLCTTLPCEDSNDCAIGSHCGVWYEEGVDPSTVPPEEEPPPVCLTGCQRDDDCLPSFFCRDDVCEPKPCRNGHLDCDFCQNCVDGACAPAGDPFCLRCSDADTVIDDSDPCNPVVLGHPLCGAGNYCWPYEGERTCAVRCTSNSDCPGGMVCTDYFERFGGCPGGLRSFGRYCLGDCIASGVCRDDPE